MANTIRQSTKFTFLRWKYVLMSVYFPRSVHIYFWDSLHVRPVFLKGVFLPGHSKLLFKKDQLQAPIPLIRKSIRSVGYAISPTVVLNSSVEMSARWDPINNDMDFEMWTKVYIGICDQQYSKQIGQISHLFTKFIAILLKNGLTLSI